MTGRPPPPIWRPLNRTARCSSRMRIACSATWGARKTWCRRPGCAGAAGRVDEDVTSPRAYLVTLVTRLCLNELDSARSRREESRADRLPEPIDLRGWRDRAGGHAWTRSRWPSWCCSSA